MQQIYFDISGRCHTFEPSGHWGRRHFCISSGFRTIEEYRPEYSKAVNSFNTNEYLEKEKEYEKNRAKCTCNIQDGADDIPDGIFTVKVTFSRPMGTGGIAIGYSQSGADFPEFKNYSWSDDRTILYLTSTLLPGTNMDLQYWEASA